MPLPYKILSSHLKQVELHLTLMEPLFSTLTKGWDAVKGEKNNQSSLVSCTLVHLIYYTYILLLFSSFFILVLSRFFLPYSSSFLFSFFSYVSYSFCLSFLFCSTQISPSFSFSKLYLVCFFFLIYLFCIFLGGRGWRNNIFIVFLEDL